MSNKIEINKEKIEISKTRQNVWRAEHPDATISQRLKQASKETQRMLGIEFGLHNMAMEFAIKMIMKYNVWKLRRMMKHANKK